MFYQSHGNNLESGTSGSHRNQFRPCLEVNFCERVEINFAVMPARFFFPPKYQSPRGDVKWFSCETNLLFLLFASECQVQNKSPDTIARKWETYFCLSTIFGWKWRGVINCVFGAHNKSYAMFYTVFFETCWLYFNESSVAYNAILFRALNHSKRRKLLLLEFYLRNLLFHDFYWWTLKESR